jgi:limonene-1,2-epoxide hydrolase
MSTAQRAAEFFAQWGTSFEGMCDAFRATFAEDCVWEQRPLAVTTGPHEAIRFLRIARAALGLATVEVDVRRLASHGNVVHTERIDYLRRADGTLIAAAPVAGILEFDGDRVVRWREYFDAPGFVRQACASGAAQLARTAYARVTATGRRAYRAPAFRAR